MSSLMIQGTTSDAGKSALVTGLCRLLARNAISVAPFKPQNMALNSAVTDNGGEIGRAQAAQARAAGLQPHTDMNPVLLKPNTDTGSQVIIDGQAIGNMDARTYHSYKPVAMRSVMRAFARLHARHDVVVVEGAGSPAEINLRRGDIANMGFALATRTPVILVADIDRGGVFAHLYGTLALLEADERHLVRGMIINRFRGDKELLQSGIDWLEKETGLPVLGTLPFLPDLCLEGEDSLTRRNSNASRNNHLKVVVAALPHLSNHTDFDALNLHPQVSLTFAPLNSPLPPADLLILPGSKNVRKDLDALREAGWPQEINRHLRYGGRLLGICGGLQMLGTQIADPHGIEGKAGTSKGLGLLDLKTRLEAFKQLRNVSGHLCRDGVRVSGYEIHSGTSKGPALQRPAIDLDGRPDGAISQDERIMATYVHGLFDQSAACASLLRWAGLQDVSESSFQQRLLKDMDRLADALEQHIDLAPLYSLLELAGPEKKERA